MKTLLRTTFAPVVLLMVGAISVHGLIPDDPDGDGVPLPQDLCPVENASGFDRNGDGCIDDGAGARHIEYWGVADNTISYVINDQGAPGVAGDADLNAIQAAFNSWTFTPGTELTASYGGTTPLAVSNGMDGVNLVTFADNSYPFGYSTLAVGLTTSFETPTEVDGRLYRPGEIFDADMIFNPLFTFGTAPSTGVQDIQSVATHEAGHLLGLSHTAVRTSTMYFVLPPGINARSLASDDVAAYRKAYGSTATMTASSRLEGIVTNGQTSDPVGGAIVYAINDATEDTTACDFTLADGSFTFVGLADGDYFVAIRPLDGTSPIDFMTAGNINVLVAGIVETDFQAESYDAAESNTDDASARTAVSVTGGSTTTVAIVTNIDATPPVVVDVNPSDGTTNAAIDGAYVIEFSERIKSSTIGSSFTFSSDAGNVAGSVAVIRDDSVLVFTPSTPLDFSTVYELRIDTDLEDLAGNALASDFVMGITTEVEPPLSISSLAPNSGVVGNSVVINGHGFVAGASPPTVTFNGTGATVVSFGPNNILAVVPEAAGTGDVVVTNGDLETSNALVFTVLSEQEIARGYETGTVPLFSAPNAIALSPDGAFAYVAVTGGIEAVVINPAGDYLSHALIQEAGEFTDVATTPDGRRAYAVNATSGDIVEIMTDPTAGLLFNTILASRNLGATPRGIVVDPFGYRAYVSTDEADIQVWDIRLGSPTYQQQVGVLDSPDGIGLAGEMAIPPAGDRLLALANSGELFVYSLGPNTLSDRIDVNPNPRQLVIDPQGQRAYVADDNGNLSVVSIAGTPFFVQDIATGGSLRGLDTTPAGQYLYATDRQLDNMKIVDLDQTHGTFRSVIENTPQVSNPADVAISNDGVYAFSVLRGDGATAPRMAVTTIGLGPALESMYPMAGAPGAKVVLRLGLVGEDVGTFVVDFNGTTTIAEQLNLTTIIATVPNGATTGPVTVTFTPNLEPVGRSSNPMQFTVLGESSPNNIRFAGTLQKDPTLTTCDYITPVIAFSPSGDYLYTGCGGTNEVNVYDIRPGSPTFHKMIASFGDQTSPGDAVHDIAITPDGKMAFIAGGLQDPALPREVQTLYADPNDPRFLTRGPAVLGPNIETPLVSTSPNNRTTLELVNDGAGTIMVLNTGNLAGGTPPSLQDSTGLGGIVVDIVHHPSSRVAYVGVESGAIRLFDTDPASATYGLAVATYSTGLTKLWSLAVSADGTTLYAYGYFFTDLFPYLIASIDVSDPMNPGGQTECQTNLETIAPFDDESFRLAPQGDFGVRTLQNVGLFRHDVDCSLSPGIVPALTPTNLIEFAFTPDGSRVYAANQGAGQIQVYDFAAAEALTIASGDAQQGVIDNTLPLSLRVRVTSSVPGNDLSGVPLTFSVVSGGGSIMTSGGPTTTTIVATDSEGFAEVILKMGPSLGAQSVSVVGTGLAGSPLTFNENANADPSTLPLSLAQVIPLDGSTDISPTTALLATFSRAVDPTSITGASFYLRAAPAGAPLPATFGFTDSNRKVSVTPSSALDVATVYEVVLTSTVAASNGGGSLTNPGVSDFTTVASQPLHLASVWPPSSLVGVAVTLSGTGFDSNFAANTVLFNGVAATPFEGTSDVLRVLVPPTALSGTVRVVTGAETSNSRAFAVLERSTSTIDDVVATIGTVNGAKSVALSGDGALCYTLGTDGDVVIPINLEEESTYPSIPVGDQPVAIVMNPEGTLAYVANFGSGSVSVIDVDPASLNFNNVVESINVGTNPLDLAISLDGDRLAVANAGSSDVSIVDTDNTSEAYHEVVATIGTANGSKSVAISGDGTLYIGTNNSILVLRASSGTAFEVTATIGTVNGTKSMAISGDGTLLFALTDGGVVLVIDLQDESPSENSVVATIGTANGSKSVAVSGDGTLLYLVQEDGDEVIIVAIDVIPGVGAGQPDGASSFTVQTHVVGTLETGADPSDVAIDPSGSGRVVVANAGDKTVTIYGRPFTAVQASFKIIPGIIIPKLPGLYVLGILELPPPLNVHDVDIASVRVFDTVGVAPGRFFFTDVNHDDVDELSMLFCRDEFLAAMPENGEHVDVVCTGHVGSDDFEGTDHIRVLRPTISKPEENERLTGGQPYTFRWTTPLQILPCDQVKIEWRQDGDDADHIDCDFNVDSDEVAGGLATTNGMDELQRLNESADVASDDWILIANHVANDGDYTWNVPFGYFPNARLRITLLWFGLKVGSSEVPFMIEMPVPTRLKSFDVTMEDGTAVLRWETSFEAGMSGYDVVRAEQEKGRYDAVTKEMVRASGSTSGGVYEYRDQTVSANRTYWYKLREVSDDGLGAEYGPYSVTYRVSNQLDQNVPNPFNPTTVIKYGIASDNQVSLLIYDVAGRKVRTLVNERQRADVYRITWDGSNDAGQRVASGVYFYKLVAGKFSQTKKMVLLK